MHDCVPVVVDLETHGNMGVLPGCYRSLKVPTLTMPVERYRRVQRHVHAVIVTRKG